MCGGSNSSSIVKHCMNSSKKMFFTALRMCMIFQGVCQCCGRMRQVMWVGVMTACQMGGCAVCYLMEIKTVRAGQHIQHGKLSRALFVMPWRCLNTLGRSYASVE